MDFSSEWQNEFDYTYSNVSYATGAATFCSEAYDRDWQGSDFSHSNISNSNFASVILYNCIFSDAILQNVNFSGAELDGSSFTNADISNANFSNITGFSKTILESTKSFAQKNLGAIVLDNNVFSGYSERYPLNFSNQKMVGASIFESDMSLLNFSGANLSSSNLGSTIFQETNFKNAIIQNAQITSADFKNADLQFVDFRGTSPDGNSMTFKNTINSDGLIEGGLNMAQGDKLVVGRHLKADGSAGVCVSVNKSGSVAGTIVFENVGGSQTGADTAMIKVDAATLTLNAAILEIYLASDVPDTTRIYLFKAQNGGICQSDALSENDVKVFDSDGEEYDGDWSLEDENGSLLLVLQVPEPAVCAQILGLVALLALFRKKSICVKK